jgi:hypothetical protein
LCALVIFDLFSFPRVVGDTRGLWASQHLGGMLAYPERVLAEGEE